MLQNKSTAILHTDDKKVTICFDTRIMCVPLNNLIAEKLMKNLCLQAAL